LGLLASSGASGLLVGYWLNVASDWQDENFDVIYTNEKVNREEWRTFEVGETRFNDDAVRRAGKLDLSPLSRLSFLRDNCLEIRC
jgi:hypothetical protein